MHFLVWKILIHFEQKKLLIESFIYANLNYYTLIWHFCTCIFTNKIDSTQKRTLQLLHDCFESSYSRLLDNAKKNMLKEGRLRYFCVEIYKTINNLNLIFIWGFEATWSLRKKPYENRMFWIKIYQAKPGNVRQGKITSFRSENLG